MESRMEDRYKIFKENETKTWESKFVWGGLYGNAPKPSIGIAKFNAKTHLLSEFNGIISTSAFYKKAQSIASKYIKWVKGEDDIYTDMEYADMYNFFIGSMGEFFFTYVLDDVKCFYLSNGGSAIRYDFNYVAPLLIGEKDFGIDLTGVVNDKNCVIQVKYWNPYSDAMLTTDILQKAYAEGVLNEHIIPNEKENVVICWLGDDSKISSHLRDNTKLKDHIIFIDRKALAKNVDNRNTTFWSNLEKRLANLGVVA